jgi:hypothetical protein
MGRKGSLVWSTGGGKVDTRSAGVCTPEEAMFVASTLSDPDSVGFFLENCRAME